MKKTSFFTLTLLIFLTLVFLPNAFAQGALFQPRVSLIYFLPKDRPARPDRITAVQELIKDTQAFFANEMERHGYGRKTFTLETDRKGEPVVHQIHGKFNDAHYRRKVEALDEVWAEVKEQFDSPQRIYFIAIDINSEMIVPWGGAAKGYYEERGKGALMAASGDGFNLPLAAHELGHAFALEHDFRDDAYIMSYGWNRHQLSKCAAAWLDAHVFFNNTSAQVNRETRIQMLAPTAAPNGIRLRFEVTDADGLHQAMLYLKPTPADPARDFKLDGCHLLDAESDTIEFVTSELVDPSQDEVTLQVIDKQGSMKRQTFPISFVHLLPPPKYVSLPDGNLAAAVREALGLGRNARITDRAIQHLRELDARKREIKNLTGLEHATQLRSLDLRENQISDIRPLENLKKLQQLILDNNRVRDISPLINMAQLTWLLLGQNPISDFTPLTNLNQLEALALWDSNIGDITLLANKTKLTHLWLGENNIRDITPLENLTQLQILYLPHNQIRDISALAGLTNLETLHLQDNSIRDISPLAGLTKLTDLRLGDNPITDKSPLGILKAQNSNLKVDIEVPLLSPIVHVGAAERPPLYWIDKEAGTPYRLVGDTVENLAPNVKDVTGLAVDTVGGTLYWTEKTSDTTGKIRRANLDGSNIQLVKDLTSVPLDIALDAVSGKIYFTNAWGTVQRLDVDGSNFQPNLITDLDTPMTIAVDVPNNKLYWTEKTSQSTGRIRSANIDGTNVQLVKDFQTNVPLDITLDTTNGKLYWLNPWGEVHRLNVDGSGVQPNFITGLDTATDIAVDPAGQKFYVTSADGKIRRRDLGSADFEEVVTGLGNPSRLVFGSIPTTVQIAEPPVTRDRAEDVNQDKTVNKTDLLLVVTALGEKPPANPSFDVNADGTVNMADVLLVIEALDDPVAAAAPSLGKTLTSLDPARLAMQLDILRAESDGSLKYAHAIAFFESLLVAIRPTETRLLANYPNPFNPETWIPYQLAKPADVTLRIYGSNGALVRTLSMGHQPAGIYHSRSRAAYWDGRNALGEKVASDIYFYTLSADDFTATRKMLIMK